MLPIAETSRARRWPAVTYVLLLANLLMFGYELSLGKQLEPFLDLWGMVPASVAGLVAGDEAHAGVLVTPLTSMYLHVGWLHLATNMLYLGVFGGSVEVLLGRGRFLAFYTLCGLIAAAAQIAAAPASSIPAVGASGAIAGVIAAYLALRPGATIAALAPVLFFMPTVDLPAVLMLGLWFLSQVLSGWAGLSGNLAGTGGVAWVAHVGGFVAGIILVWFFRQPRRRIYHW
jgi:membrane associated rhomboid family serine protease